MSEVRGVDQISILLVDADATSSAGIRTLLMDGKYEVVTANQGEEALCILREKQNEVKIQLVLTDIALPDMSPFEFAETVEKETRLPVVMICHTYDETAMVKGLLCGAIFCLVKPVSLGNVKNLWQHCIVKAREVLLESDVTERESSASSVTCMLKKEALLHELGGSSQGYRKRKMEEVEKVEGSSRGQTSSFIPTPYLPDGLCLFNAVTPEALGCNNSPRFSSDLIRERLQQQDPMCLEEQQKLQTEMIFPFPTYLNPHNPPIIANWSLDLGINAGYQPPFGSHSQLMDFLENPHYRDQLKRILNETLVRWLSQFNGYVNPSSEVWGTVNVDQVQGYPQLPSMLTSSNVPLGTMPSLAPGLPRTSAARLVQGVSPAFVPGHLGGFIQSSLPFPATEAPPESTVGQVLDQQEEVQSQSQAPQSPSAVLEEMGETSSSSSFPDDVLDALMKIID